MCQALGAQRCGKGTEVGHAVMELLLVFVVIFTLRVPVPSFKNKEALKQYPVVDVTGDRSKIRCCKEQYCIGTWHAKR